jgi:hypothetical protein
MATPATSPNLLVVASSSPMSHFSYRGAGLEMADDEEESTFAHASSSSAAAAPAAPVPAPLLPPRLQKSQESSSIPSFLNAQHVPGNVPSTYHQSHEEQVRHGTQSRATEVFSAIESIPYCDDDFNYRQVNAEGNWEIGVKDDMRDGSLHPDLLSGDVEMSRDSLRRDCSLNVGVVSSEIGGLPFVGSNDRMTGGPPQPQPPAHINGDHLTNAYVSLHGQVHKDLSIRDPIPMDVDDDVDDDDSNSNEQEKKQQMDHEVDYDDDFIKSFLDQAVDAPCQRFTVAPCMADLMDRQLDLFMVSLCKRPSRNRNEF